jgi:hypothetical protein
MIRVIDTTRTIQIADGNTAAWPTRFLTASVRNAMMIVVNTTVATSPPSPSFTMSSGMSKSWITP